MRHLGQTDVMQHDLLGNGELPANLFSVAEDGVNERESKYASMKHLHAA